MRFCYLLWLAHYFFFFTAKCKRDVHVFLVAVVVSKFSLCGQASAGLLNF